MLRQLSTPQSEYRQRARQPNADAQWASTQSLSALLRCPTRREDCPSTRWRRSVASALVALGSQDFESLGAASAIVVAGRKRGFLVGKSNLERRRSCACLQRAPASASDTGRLPQDTLAPDEDQRFRRIRFFRRVAERFP